MAPANCTGFCLFTRIYAETLKPPLAEELPDELLVEAELPLAVEEDSLNRFRTICSLLLGLRLNVICCSLELGLPILRATCSPPPLVGVRLMVICSGLTPLPLLLRLRTISGPLLEAGLLEVGLALLLLRLRIISGTLLEAGLVLTGAWVPAPR
jgi:hypothetical protein